MSKLIAISESFSQISDLDEKKFTKFMQMKPIWVHFNISQNEYLSRSAEEKASMIRRFYDYMESGKNVVFFLIKLDIFHIKITNFDCIFLLFLESEPIATSSKFSGPSNASIFSLSKEISESDQSVRSKMVVANIEGIEKVGEQIWEEEGYFGKLNPDYSCHKNDFPENALIYVNICRDTMIYCDYTILAQIIPFKSSAENIDEAVKEDKKLVKIYMPMCDTVTGQLLGVKESIGYIMVRNEEEEKTFLSYGFSSEHSTVLYCHSKQPIPNIFRGTSFNTHKLQTGEQGEEIRSLFLPSYYH